MLTYQSMLYKVALDDYYGWDYTGDILFESRVHPQPANAMVELQFCDPAHPNWFATFRTIERGEIIDEQIFDASVIEID
jgi:hypothetical protein